MLSDDERKTLLNQKRNHGRRSKVPPATRYAILRDVLNGTSISDASAKGGVSRSMVHRWIKQERERANNQAGTDSDK